MGRSEMENKGKTPEATPLVTDAQLDAIATKSKTDAFFQNAALATDNCSPASGSAIDAAFNELVIDRRQPIWNSVKASIVASAGDSATMAKYGLIAHVETDASGEAIGLILESPKQEDMYNSQLAVLAQRGVSAEDAKAQLAMQNIFAGAYTGKMTFDLVNPEPYRTWQ